MLRHQPISRIAISPDSQASQLFCGLKASASQGGGLASDLLEVIGSWVSLVERNQTLHEPIHGAWLVKSEYIGVSFFSHLGYKAFIYFVVVKKYSVLCVDAIEFDLIDIRNRPVSSFGSTIGDTQSVWKMKNAYPFG